MSREGDRVAVDPSLYCNECHYCRIGHNNLCQRWGAIGVTVPGGGGRVRGRAGRQLCVGCPITSTRPMRRLDRAAVLRGARLRRAAQPTRVARADLRRRHDGPDDARAGQARRRGERRHGGRQPRPARRWPGSWAARTRRPPPTILEQPYGWELVVDATGNDKAIQDGLGRVAPAGTFLQFGVAAYAARATIEPYKIYNQEITITGSMAVLHSYERAAELFAAGVLDPRVFITDRLPLEQYADALDTFQAGKA